MAGFKDYRSPEYIFDIETTGLQSAYGPKRDLRITEYALLPRGGTAKDIKHYFTDILRGPFEKFQAGKISRDDFIDTISGDKGYFTKGALIRGDIENILLKRLAQAHMSTTPPMPEAALVKSMMKMIKEGKEIAGWNFGFDIGTLEQAAERHGIQGFRASWAEGISRGQIRDLAEGVHRFRYERFMSGKGLGLVHAMPPGITAGTLESRIARLELAKSGNVEALRQLEKHIEPHEGFLKLRENYAEINTLVRERLAGMDTSARAAMGLEYLPSPKAFDIRKYDHAVAYLESLKGENVWRDQPFAAGTKTPVIRYTMDWSTESLREGLGAAKVDMRIAKQASISAKELAWQHHDPRYDVLFENELAELFSFFGESKGRSSLQNFEPELWKRYGVGVEAFEEATRRASIIGGEDKTIKAYINSHASSSTEAARLADRVHATATAESILMGGNIEGLQAQTASHKQAVDYLKTKQSGYLTTGLRKGFRKGWQELWDTAAKASKKHPKAAMAVGIGAGLLLLNSIVPSKMDRQPEPYNDGIDGQKYSYNQWQMVSGIHPSLIGMQGDFGSGAAFFGVMEKRAREIFQRGVSIEGIPASPKLLFESGYAAEHFALMDMNRQRYLAGMADMFRPTAEMNLGVHHQITATAAKQPLYDHVSGISADMLHGLNPVRPEGSSGFHAIINPSGRIRSTNLTEIVAAPISFSRMSDSYRASAGGYRPDTSVVGSVYRRGFPKMLSDLHTDEAIRTVGDDITSGARSLSEIEVRAKFRPEAFEIDSLLRPASGFTDLNPSEIGEYAFPTRRSAGFISTEVPEFMMARAGTKASYQNVPWESGMAGTPVQFPSTNWTDKWFRQRGRLRYSDEVAWTAMTSSGQSPGMLEYTRDKHFATRLEGIRRGWPDTDSGFLQIQGMNSWPYGDFRSGRKQLWYKSVSAETVYDETDAALRDAGYISKQFGELMDVEIHAHKPGEKSVEQFLEGLEEQLKGLTDENERKVLRGRIKKTKSFMKHMSLPVSHMASEFGDLPRWKKPTRLRGMPPAPKSAYDMIMEVNKEYEATKVENKVAQARKMLAPGYGKMEWHLEQLRRETWFQSFIKTGAYKSELSWPQSLIRIKQITGLSTPQMIAEMQNYRLESLGRIQEIESILERKTKSVIMNKEGAKLSHWIMGGKATLRVNYTTAQYDKIVDLLVKSGHDRITAEYIIQQEMHLEAATINTVTKRQKSLLWFTGKKTTEIVARTPQKVITLSQPTTWPKGSEFFKGAAKYAKVEALAYPQMMKAIWKQNVGTMRKLWMTGSALFGHMSRGSYSGYTALMKNNPQWLDGDWVKAKQAEIDKTPNKIYQELRQFKMNAGQKLRNWGAAIKQPAGGTGFAHRAGAKALDATGKIIQRFGLMQAIGGAVVAGAWVGAGDYKFRPGGFATELAAVGSEWAVWSAAESRMYGAYKAGMMRGLSGSLINKATGRAASMTDALTLKAAAKAIPGPWWLKAGAWVGSQVLGYVLGTAAYESVRAIGHGIFGTAEKRLPPGQMMPFRPEPMYNHVVSSAIIGGNSWDAMEPGGINLTPFGSGYNPERVPAMQVPKMRQPQKVLVFPKTAGLPMRLYANRNKSRITRQVVNPPRQRYDRGTAA